MLASPRPRTKLILLGCSAREQANTSLNSESEIPCRYPKYRAGIDYSRKAVAGQEAVDGGAVAPEHLREAVLIDSTRAQALKKPCLVHIF